MVVLPGSSGSRGGRMLGTSGRRISPLMPGETPGGTGGRGARLHTNRRGAALSERACSFIGSASGPGFADASVGNAHGGLGCPARDGRFRTSAASSMSSPRSRSATIRAVFGSEARFPDALTRTNRDRVPANRISCARERKPSVTRDRRGVGHRRSASCQRVAQSTARISSSRRLTNANTRCIRSAVVGRAPPVPSAMPRWASALDRRAVQLPLDGEFDGLVRSGLCVPELRPRPGPRGLRLGAHGVALGFGGIPTYQVGSRSRNTRDSRASNSGCSPRFREISGARVVRATSRAAPLFGTASTRPRHPPDFPRARWLSSRRGSDTSGSI